MWTRFRRSERQVRHDERAATLGQPRDRVVLGPEASGDEGIVSGLTGSTDVARTAGGDEVLDAVVIAQVVEVVDL